MSAAAMPTPMAVFAPVEEIVSLDPLDLWVPARRLWFCLLEEARDLVTVFSVFGVFVEEG